jgi:hypothetical protein
MSVVSSCSLVWPDEAFINITYKWNSTSSASTSQYSAITYGTITSTGTVASSAGTRAVLALVCMLVTSSLVC